MNRNRKIKSLRPFIKIKGQIDHQKTNRLETLNKRITLKLIYRRKSVGTIIAKYKSNINEPIKTMIIDQIQNSEL